jgi:hypothetical protein
MLHEEAILAENGMRTIERLSDRVIVRFENQKPQTGVKFFLVRICDLQSPDDPIAQSLDS